MAGFSDYAENTLIRAMFRATGNPVTFPSTWYVALHTADPGDTGGSEVSTVSTGYARVSVANNSSQWNDTGSSNTDGKTSNINTITFPTATANWGQVTHFSLWDASTAGNMWYSAALQVTKTVTQDDIMRFDAGLLTVTLS